MIVKMQFNIKDRVEYKNHVFEIRSRNSIYNITIYLDNHHIEFHKNYIEHLGCKYPYDSDTFASKIPGIVENYGKWIMPGIIDLSEVADLMINILQVFIDNQQMLERYTQNIFASNTKSARKLE